MVSPSNTLTNIEILGATSAAGHLLDIDVANSAQSIGLPHTKLARIRHSPAASPKVPHSSCCNRKHTFSSTISSINASNILYSDVDAIMLDANPLISPGCRRAFKPKTLKAAGNKSLLPLPQQDIHSGSSIAHAGTTGVYNSLANTGVLPIVSPHQSPDSKAVAIVSCSRSNAAAPLHVSTVDGKTLSVGLSFKQRIQDVIRKDTSVPAELCSWLSSEVTPNSVADNLLSTSSVRAAKNRSTNMWISLFKPQAKW